MTPQKLTALKTNLKSQMPDFESEMAETFQSELTNELGYQDPFVTHTYYSFQESVVKILDLKEGGYEVIPAKCSGYKDLEYGSFSVVARKPQSMIDIELHEITERVKDSQASEIESLKSNWLEDMINNHLDEEAREEQRIKDEAAAAEIKKRKNLREQLLELISG